MQYEPACRHTPTHARRKRSRGVGERAREHAAPDARQRSRAQPISKTARGSSEDTARLRTSRGRVGQPTAARIGQPARLPAGLPASIATRGAPARPARQSARNPVGWPAAGQRAARRAPRGQQARPPAARRCAYARAAPPRPRFRANTPPHLRPCSPTLHCPSLSARCPAFSLVCFQNRQGRGLQRAGGKKEVRKRRKSPDPEKRRTHIRARVVH